MTREMSPEGDCKIIDSLCVLIAVVGVSLIFSNRHIYPPLVLPSSDSLSRAEANRWWPCRPTGSLRDVPRGAGRRQSLSSTTVGPFGRYLGKQLGLVTLAVLRACMSIYLPRPAVGTSTKYCAANFRGGFCEIHAIRIAGQNDPRFSPGTEILIQSQYVTRHDGHRQEIMEHGGARTYTFQASLTSRRKLSFFRMRKIHRAVLPRV